MDENALVGAGERQAVSTITCGGVEASTKDRCRRSDCTIEDEGVSTVVASHIRKANRTDLADEVVTFTTTDSRVGCPLEEVEGVVTSVSLQQGGADGAGCMVSAPSLLLSEPMPPPRIVELRKVVPVTTLMVSLEKTTSRVEPENVSVASSREIESLLAPPSTRLPSKSVPEKMVSLPAPPRMVPPV